MTIKIFSELKKNGFLMVPYVLVQTLGADTTIVLVEIIAELNHAENLGLNYGDDFLLNKDRIANKLGIEFDNLEEILDELENLSFIFYIQSKPLGVTLKEIQIRYNVSRNGF